MNLQADQAFGVRPWFWTGCAGASILSLVLGSAGCGTLGGRSHDQTEPPAPPVSPSGASGAERLGPGALSKIALGLPPSSVGAPTPAAGSTEDKTEKESQDNKGQEKADKSSAKKDGKIDILPAVLADTPTTPVIPSPPAITPVNLSQALGLAGVDNPTIAIAQQAVQVALAEQLQARSLLLPNLNAGLSYDHHHGHTQSSFGAIREVDDREAFYIGGGAGAVAAGTIAIPGVELFTPLTDAIFAPKVARQVVVTRNFEAMATNNNVLLDVGVLYYGLVGAEGQLAAIRQSEREFREVARLTAEHARAGTGTPADADRGLSEALLLHQQEQRAEEEVAVASARLAQLLNLDPAVRLQSAEGPVQLLMLVDAQEPLENLIQTALEFRPEMGARTAAIGASLARYRQECARPFLPTLAVGASTGDFGGGSNITTPGASGPFHYRSDIDVMAFWTLQNLGFGNLSLTRRRRAEVKEAEADRVITINQIRDEVAEAFADAAARRRDQEVAWRQLKRAREGYKLDLQRVRGVVGGVGAERARPIEVLNSARLLVAARQEFVRSVTVYNQAQLRLFVSLGQPPTVAPVKKVPPASEAPQESRGRISPSAKPTR